MKLGQILTVAACFVATNISAQVIFQDNFNQNTAGPNVTPIGWTVTNGTVDVLGPGYFDQCSAAYGRCIDMDGGTSQAGTLSKSFNLLAGTPYVTTFELHGSPTNEVVDVKFGTTTLTLNIAPSAPFTLYSISFTPSSSGAYVLSFHDNSSDFNGTWLDNVTVSSVPEPGVALLLSLGVAFVGARRFASAYRK